MADHYLVWCPEQDETQRDARKIDAFDSEHAAQMWADREDSDSADYAICAGRWEPVVYVRAPDGEVTMWRVCGETVPSYSSEQVGVTRG